jgi:hypothetical protein
MQFFTGYSDISGRNLRRRFHKKLDTSGDVAWLFVRVDDGTNNAQITTGRGDTEILDGSREESPLFDFVIRQSERNRQNFSEPNVFNQRT